MRYVLYVSVPFELDHDTDSEPPYVRQDAIRNAAEAWFHKHQQELADLIQPGRIREREVDCTVHPMGEVG